MFLKKYIYFAFSLLLAFVLYLYWPVLGFSYVWDDSLLFLDKTALLNEPLSWELLSEPVLPGTSYLRPLVFFTYYVEFQLFGQSSAVSHAVNLAIFIVNIILLFGVARRISLALEKRSWAGPLCASAIYAVHPAMIEATAWVSGRFDLLVTSFILLSVFVYLGRGYRGLRYLGVSILMLAGLLSKELAFVIPALLLCVWVACNAKSDEAPRETFYRAVKENLWLLLLLLLMFFAYLYMRAGSANGVYHDSLSYAYAKVVWWDQLLPLEALKLYFIQTFLPFYGVNPQHPIESTTPWSPVSLVASGAVLFFLGFWLMQAWKYRAASAWLGLAGLLCVLPVIHIIPLSVGGNVGHDRFLTTAVAFFSLAICFLPYRRVFSKFNVSSKAIQVYGVLVLGGWMLISAWTVHSVLPFWGSDQQLWNWAWKSNPEAERVRYNYFYGAIRAGRGDIVEQSAKELIEEHGGLNVDEQVLYAHVLFQNGDPESMQYLKGVFYALPKFHEIPGGRFDVDKFYMTAAQMSGAYSLYSVGMLVFEANAESALEYNNIALWYLRDSERVPLNYQRSAILYALGKYEEAEALLDEQNSIIYYQKESAQAMVRQMLSIYCEHENASRANCLEIERRGII